MRDHYKEKSLCERRMSIEEGGETGETHSLSTRSELDAPTQRLRFIFKDNNNQTKLNQK